MVKLQAADREQQRDQRRSPFEKRGNASEADLGWISGFKDTAIRRGNLYKPWTAPQIQEDF